jgi:hypothetical protein
MRTKFKFIYALMALALAVGLVGIQPIQPVEAGTQALRISQAYGGGGNPGATYTHDYIEIFNGSANPVSLSGLSVQYASATGTGNFGANSAQITLLPDVSLDAGTYYLILGASGTNGQPLPIDPDLTEDTPINLGVQNGKIALVNSQTSLGCNGGSNPCSPEQLALIIDLVGYGSANFYEGNAPAPLISSTTSLYRQSAGCQDTDQNDADFTAGAPTPRNSASPTHICGAGDQPPTVTSTVPANNAVNVPVDSTITITFSEPVTVTGDWFTISCTKSGTHTAAVEDTDPVYVLTPDPVFSTSDVCTVTVLADNVNDDDSDDDTADYMLENYVFSFTTAEGCGDPFTPIYDIQGNGAATPISGQTVTTEGIVTGDFQTGGKRGFFIQDEMGDDDPATSDGIFIYYPNAIEVNVGDKVRVTGRANEYYQLTQLTGSAMQICSSGNSITPLELTLPFDSKNHEPIEGMLVTFPQALVLSEYFNFDRYGELLLTSTRHTTPTAYLEPGPDAVAAQEAHLLDSIAVDDGSSTQNPEYLRHPDGTAFGLDHYFRGGDTIEGLTGVMDYNFNEYKIQPVGTATYTSVNPRTEAPELVVGEIRVASLNVLNYFVTIDTGTPICGPAGDMECRGADNETELERQTVKIINAIVGMDADIVGLIEIENEHPGQTADEPVATIVAALNEAVGSEVYSYIATGPIGTDAIKQAILYKTEKVDPVGEFAILDATVDPDFDTTRNRPALAMSFQDKITGEVFTVSVNHLKSKGSACDGDPDLGDGAGNCNLTRWRAAKALVRWLESDPTEAGSDMYVIIGDLNSNAMEDPIDAIKLGADQIADTADDYYNLVERFHGNHVYGYVYGGQTGYLDHALANRKLASYVLDANFWHINADESDVFDYDITFKPDPVDAMFDPTTPYRASDHDPVLISILLNHAPTAEDDTYTVDRNGVLSVEAPGVLLNDTDVNIYDRIWVELVNDTGPYHGTLVLNPDGSFTYTPDGNFMGVDTFEYMMFATPGLMGDYSDSAVVRINVTGDDFQIYLPLIFME